METFENPVPVSEPEATDSSDTVPAGKTLGILGGMGPLATADLYRKIVTLTPASCDNDHIRVIIDSNARIPDRTAAILHSGPDPLPEMLSALHNLEACGVDCIVMPCNTAHYYLPRLQAETQIPFISMLEVTAEACASLYPGKTAALLATDGTIRTGLYDRELEARHVPCLHPDTAEQKTVMRLVYEVVKASRPFEPETEIWRNLLSSLRSRGADYFILACTELPVLADTLGLPGPFVDPTEELARAAVRFCII